MIYHPVFLVKTPFVLGEISEPHRPTAPLLDSEDTRSATAGLSRLPGA